MRTSKLILFFFAFLFILSACKKKKDVTQEQTTETNIKVIEQAGDKDLIFTYEKTACFGTCPQFKMEVFNDLSVLYEGRNFVDNKGKFSTTFSMEDMKAIFLMSEQIHYEDMNEVYDNKMVSDLPSIITGLWYNGSIKTVHNRYNGPADLKNLYKLIDEAVSKLEMVEIILD